MICIKHNGYFVIRDLNGLYYSITKTEKPLFQEKKSAAYKWKRENSAKEYLRNGLNNNPKYHVEMINDDSQRINKQMLDDTNSQLIADINYIDLEEWINYLSKITNGFTDISLALNRATAQRKKIDKIITDVRHYIEFGEFNAYQGYKLFALLQNLLRQRRSYKDMIFMLENIQIKSKDINYIYYLSLQLKNRGYKPKVLRTMFNL